MPDPASKQLIPMTESGEKCKFTYHKSKLDEKTILESDNGDKYENWKDPSYLCFTYSTRKPMFLYVDKVKENVGFRSGLKKDKNSLMLFQPKPPKSRSEKKKNPTSRPEVKPRSTSKNATGINTSTTQF